MKTFFKLAVPALAFSAVAFVAMGNSAAQAAPAMHRGAYCLTYEQDEMDCGFTTYAQCEASASGIGGDCSRDVFDSTTTSFSRPAMRRG
ncbi:DUF3551 domain-containing protein [Bradyrhizobium prioriisuperbiae]|uniref:DUF3551 domain-containing protein n=1 Tax=Bradyrhizobium prioriisuperbiae TaxID=2854389 RepID=UPI0028EE06E7|nr:DUF3551 domain-containing protein [Bradyrhizobium prioritasuperba]